ncbi:hypothetical protein C8F04DRAFT_1260471 [Mycena alexandri]|uniref:Uncharacterized protein n=1 Tax=Mycena alexandri TaxID=1745969 RepID=A0AAD6SUF1_9AGAR|nr:hypothetical protein C8F04DRAFT_1260471 [Mycena alexandri]
MAPRKATTTGKAKQVAALAVAEALEESEVLKVVKKKARGPGKKKAKPDPDAAATVTVEDKVDEEVKSKKVKQPVINIDWTDELTWTLVTGIEVEETHDGLFPGVGAIKRTGGHPKTYYYYLLAVLLFAENPLYKALFAINPEDTQTKLAKQRTFWADKVKNRITVLVAKTRENITMMGQTGAGVASADEISPGTGFANKWDIIKDESPWHFQMRALVADRPNLQPVGLGNNASGFDVELLLPHDREETASSVADETLYNPSSDAIDDSNDSFSPASTLGAQAASVKRKRTVSVTNVTEEKPQLPPTKKTKPQPASSIPVPESVPAPAASSKKVKMKDQFSAAALAEEETAQQALSLRREKNTATKEIRLARIQSAQEIRLAKSQVKADAKREERAAKLELVRLKMQHDHDLQMARLQAHGGLSSMSFSGGGGGGGGTPHDMSFFDSDLPTLPTASYDSAFGDASGYGGFNSSMHGVQ